MSASRKSDSGDSTAAVNAAAPSRRRLLRDDRYRQLIDVAWQLVRQEGTDALTLGRLAESAGVTKPVVYDHFVTRNGLLAALYREFDDRQTALIDTALEVSEKSLAGRAMVIAESYVNCVVAQGRELPGVISALASSPELQLVKSECETAFMEKCRGVLAPFAGQGHVSQAGLRVMLGAAEALSFSATANEISAAEAKQELSNTIVDMVLRTQGERLTP
jgi:AcrR family transcriptional regulator